MVSLVRLRSPSVALIAAATTLTAITFTFSTSSCNRQSGGDDGEGAEEGPPPEQAEPPNVDLDAVHKAFWDMKGATQTEQLQSFEQEVNKYNYTDDFVSVDAEKRNDDAGNPTTVVTGYVDKKNGQGGFNKDTDKPVFRFVQTAAPTGNNVNYEYLDGYGNVYFRGARAVPQTPFYMSYYFGRGPVVRYYTPYARIGYLRTWRVGWRTGPHYLGWRTRFGGWRSGYYGRVVGLRSTYGISRARVGVRFGYYGGRGVGFRGGVRAGGYRGGRSYGGGGRSYGGGRSTGGGGRRRR